MKVYRKKHKVSAGSMADIAFLLLLFFLVTTTILNDQGILTKLPPYENDIISVRYPEEYILNILINDDDLIMLEGEIIPLNKAGKLTEDFILLNNGVDSTKNSIVSLSCSRDARYSAYISVYDQLKMAYNKVWDHSAFKRFGQAYHRLNKTRQMKIRSRTPFIVSEAEAMDFK